MPDVFLQDAHLPSKLSTTTRTMWEEQASLLHYMKTHNMRQVCLNSASKDGLCLVLARCSLLAHAVAATGPLMVCSQDYQPATSSLCGVLMLAPTFCLQHSYCMHVFSLCAMQWKIFGEHQLKEASVYAGLLDANPRGTGVPIPQTAQLAARSHVSVLVSLLHTYMHVCTASHCTAPHPHSHVC
jgi:hypothetical protein